MDLRKTIDQVVRASDLPLSIIIIGVGAAADFKMEILDADKEQLYSNALGKFAYRDCV